MPAPPDEPRDERSSLGPGFWLRDRLPLETETAVFILVNVLDIFLTYLLLAQGSHFEANPIARYFLDRWGPKGVIGFKLALVALVCVIAQVVARTHLRTARRLLYGVTALVAAVVVYSLGLLLRAT
jgi:hypothetical protein